MDGRKKDYLSHIFALLIWE